MRHASGILTCPESGNPIAEGRLDLLPDTGPVCDSSFDYYQLLCLVSVNCHCSSCAIHASYRAHHALVLSYRRLIRRLPAMGSEGTGTLAQWKPQELCTAEVGGIINRRARRGEGRGERGVAEQRFH